MRYRHYRPAPDACDTPAEQDAYYREVDAWMAERADLARDAAADLREES